MYPDTQERVQRIKEVQEQLQPLVSERDRLNHAINSLYLEVQILQELEVLDKAVNHEITLTTKNNDDVPRV